MTLPIPAWGSGPWGSFSWGGGVGAGTIAVESIEAFRENVIRVTFNTPVYYSGILDVPDASKPVNYTVATVSGTVGLDGEPVRPVNVVEVRLAEPNVLDLVLDRPMTPFPAAYIANIQNVFSLDLMSAIPTTESQFPGLFQRLTPPSVDTSTPSRDVANAQTAEGTISISDPANPINLGAFRVDDTGDFAGEEGLIALKNRIYRRLATRKGAFAHLPEYGIGVKDYGKRLATSAAINALVSNSEVQIAREPEVQFVRVRAILDNLDQGLLRLRIAVRTKNGKATAFDAPFVTTG